jgi:hypothetical protein
MVPASEIRAQAIALIEQLSQDKLIAVVQLLEFLAEPLKQNTVSPQEAQLLKVIESRLPEETQVRLEQLRERCEWGRLSEAEHQELVSYEDLQEQQRIERLEALIELAKLKSLNLMQLNQQVQSKSQSFHAI